MKRSTRGVIPPLAIRGSALALVLALSTGANAACPSAPLPLCRNFGKTSLVLDAVSGRFDWKATRGPATSLGDFGSPATTAYSLCAWDDDGLVAAVEVPPNAICDGESCWSPKGSAGWRYTDPLGANGALESLQLSGSTRSRTKLRARAIAPGGFTLPLNGNVVVQFLRDDSPICFESSLASAAFRSNDDDGASAKANYDSAAPVPALASAGCAAPTSLYPAGVSTNDSLVHDDLTRTFRVHVPASYDGVAPMPVVFLLHGGFGSGAQVETSSRILDVAEAEGFVVVSPDGTAGPGGVRTWNADGCCGASASGNVDDVGFVAAVLDHLEASTCVDTRRVYAAGMSNGSMLSHRLACELADRIRAVTAVSGTDMTYICHPARPVPTLTIHGSADANVPYDGGFGCGAAGVSFRSVPATLQRWIGLNGCSDTVATTSLNGDATCSSFAKCAAGSDVSLCVLDGGGHQWPGGVPPAGAGLPGCPFGYQSQAFSASLEAWRYFEAHPVK